GASQASVTPAPARFVQAGAGEVGRKRRLNAPFVTRARPERRLQHSSTRRARMNAIELLDQQHDDVENLFKRFDATEDSREKESLFTEIADELAIHTTLEERHFYPAVRSNA